MKFLYIENYLKISKNDKLDFFALINRFENFKIIHKKIFLDANSILLEFSDNSDIDFANTLFEKFFEKIILNNFKIKITSLKNATQKDDLLVLTYKDNTTRNITLK